MSLPPEVQAIAVQLNNLTYTHLKKLQDQGADSTDLAESVSTTARAISGAMHTFVATHGTWNDRGRKEYSFDGDTFRPLNLVTLLDIVAKKMTEGRRINYGYLRESVQVKDGDEISESQVGLVLKGFYLFMLKRAFLEGKTQKQYHDMHKDTVYTFILSALCTMGFHPEGFAQFWKDVKGRKRRDIDKLRTDGNSTYIQDIRVRALYAKWLQSNYGTITVAVYRYFKQNYDAGLMENLRGLLIDNLATVTNKKYTDKQEAKMSKEIWAVKLGYIRDGILITSEWDKGGLNRGQSKIFDALAIEKKPKATTKKSTTKKSTTTGKKTTQKSQLQTGSELDRSVNQAMDDLFGDTPSTTKDTSKKTSTRGATQSRAMKERLMRLALDDAAFVQAVEILVDKLTL